MARPSNEELMEERRAVAEILGTAEGETNPEAAQRILAELKGIAEGIAEIIQPEEGETLLQAAARLVTLSQGAKDASGAHIPAVAGSTPAPASIDDDDPTDPRPAMNPLLGWNTPEVVEWANRRRNRNA